MAANGPIALARAWADHGDTIGQPNRAVLAGSTQLNRSEQREQRQRGKQASFCWHGQPNETKPWQCPRLAIAVWNFSVSSGRPVRFLNNFGLAAWVGSSYGARAWPQAFSR